MSGWAWFIIVLFIVWVSICLGLITECLCIIADELRRIGRRNQ